jgi:hypothetical protein
MTFKRNAQGHAFDFDRGVCGKCGMTREQFQDSDEPVCKGLVGSRSDVLMLIDDPEAE